MATTLEPHRTDASGVGRPSDAEASAEAGVSPLGDAARQLPLDATGSVELALSDLVRMLNRPWVQRALMEQAGVAVDVGAYWALKRIGDAGQLRLSDLAASLSVDASTITHRVQALVRDALVERLDDPAAGRACVVPVTPAGAAALERLRDARHELFERLLAGWTDDEKHALARATGRLADTLKREMPNRE